MGSAQLTGSCQCQCFATSWSWLNHNNSFHKLKRQTKDSNQGSVFRLREASLGPFSDPSRQLDSEEAAREDDVAGAGLPAGDDEQARAGGVGEEQGGGDDGCHQRIKGFVSKREQLL